MKLRVLLIDDHAVVRDGLRTVLIASKRFQVEDEASTAREGIRKAIEQPFDAVVLDLSLPDMSGIEAVKQIREHRPRLPVIIFSMHADRESCLRALRAGALGYVTKQSAAEEIVQAIQTVAVGRRYVSPSIADHLFGAAIGGNADGAAPHEALSDREFEVLCLIGSGATVTQIAERLCLSVKTVSTYRARLLEKLRLENNSQAIKYVVEHSLVR
ncbi:MAG TPA: response regulator transcription factor [Candidatus Binatia bacterium]|nr:response regulator transcription factor [Candidatus Binatia bacterium]